MDHIRLVIPAELIKGDVKVYEDILVEKIFMERHTTGIDPYTGVDYGDAEIPAEHQYDPRNGTPIFHRYIAGTQHRLEWPWEREEKVEDTSLSVSANDQRNETGKKSLLRRFTATVAQPLTSLSRWRNQNKQPSQHSKPKKTMQEKLEKLETNQAKEAKHALPRTNITDHPEAYDGTDTTRNVVFDADSMFYTLVAPPFPDTLAEELRSHIHDYGIQAKKDASEDPDAKPFVKIKRNTGPGVLAREVARKKQSAAQAMKTPMQLRWELAQKSKAKKSPLVDEESLLVALGGHMAKKPGKPYLGKKTSFGQAAELD
jgi:large subunit ribosomal protein L24